MESEKRPAKDMTLIGFEAHNGKNIIFPNAGERMSFCKSIFFVAEERLEKEL